MKALLVGAGAVGQVFGYHLQRAGAEVSFYVRPKYADECRRGFDLYPLNRRNPRRAPVRFEGFGVLSTLDEARAQRWDVVLLCMSSTGLRASGPSGEPGSRGTEWFPDFARAIGDATLVTLQPGIEDRDYILRSFPAERLVTGMISLISYHAPLPGESVPAPGMAYWFPPLSPSPVSGPRDRAQPVASALKAGGMPAAVHDDVAREVAFPSAALNCMLCALEAERWSFLGLRRSASFRLAIEAAREAFEIAGRKVGARPPLALRAGLPLVLAFLLTQARRFVPLDLETYFRVHFTKVGDQTRLGNEEYIREGKSAGLPTAALEKLRERLAAAGR